MAGRANLLGTTPSQTVGPYFAYGLIARQYGYDHDQIADSVIVRDGIPGERIRIFGRVFDGAGVPIDDAIVELWQADAAGRYPGAGDFADKTTFNGFGRCGTGTHPDNSFVFETIKPGATGNEAPHINVIVLMRGLLLHAFTRIYFSDEASANAGDPLLASVPERRRGTLIAMRGDDAAYRFDIHMQGDAETVFLDV